MSGLGIEGLLKSMVLQGHVVLPTSAQLPAWCPSTSFFASFSLEEKLGFLILPASAPGPHEVWGMDGPQSTWALSFLTEEA